MRNDEEKRGFGFTPISKMKVKRLSWLIEYWIPRGGLVFISGFAKAGKSTLGLYICLKLLSSLYLFERFKVRKGKIHKVLYVCLEDHLGEIRERAKKFMKGKQLPRNLLISKADSLSLPSDFEKLEADITNSKANILFLDTLRRAHDKDEDSSTEMAPILNKLREFVRKYQLTILIIHHAGQDILKAKDQKKDIAKTWLRGTSDFPANYDVLIGLDRKTDNSTVVRVFHKYRSNLQKMMYRVEKSEEVDPVTGDNFITDFILDGFSFEKQDLEDERIVFQSVSEVPFSGNSIQKQLKGKVSRPRIDLALNRLQRKGRIKQEGKGRNARWICSSAV